jgi:hypothetical protein
MQLLYFVTGDASSADLVLSIAGTPAPGATLQTTTNNALPSQLWQITPGGRIVSAGNSSLALSIGPDNALVVDTVQQYNEAQLWAFSPGSDGLGTIASLKTGQVLTLAAPLAPLNSAVGLAPSGSSAAQQWSGNGFGVDSLLTTVTNSTPNALTLAAQAVEGTTNLSGSIPLPPGTSVTIVSSYNDGLATNLGVFDANYSSSSSVASWVVHQHRAGMVIAGEVWVDTINYVDGYQITNVTAEKGSVRDSLPGNAAVTVAHI